VREIITEITIAAPPEKVWEILMDFPSYGDWNPFVTAIDGESKVGEQLAASLRLPGGKTRGFKPKVTAVEPERLFQWFGKVGFDALFGGRHSFRLSPTEHGTRFEHSERFTGVLASMMFSMMGRRTEAGFRAMNDALKARSEG